MKGEEKLKSVDGPQCREGGGVEEEGGLCALDNIRTKSLSSGLGGRNARWENSIKKKDEEGHTETKSNRRNLDFAGVCCHRTTPAPFAREERIRCDQAWRIRGRWSDSGRRDDGFTWHQRQHLGRRRPPSSSAPRGALMPYIGPCCTLKLTDFSNALSESGYYNKSAANNIYHTNICKSYANHFTLLRFCLFGGPC